MLRRLTREALRRGVVGGSRPWLAVGVVVVGIRVARFAAVGRPERVLRHELAPGETLQITARRLDPTPRGGRSLDR